MGNTCLQAEYGKAYEPINNLRKKFFPFHAGGFVFTDQFDIGIDRCQVIAEVMGNQLSHSPCDSQCPAFFATITDLRHPVNSPLRGNSRDRRLRNWRFWWHFVDRPGSKDGYCGETA